MNGDGLKSQEQFCGLFKKGKEVGRVIIIIRGRSKKRLPFRAASCYNHHFHKKNVVDKAIKYPRKSGVLLVGHGGRYKTERNTTNRFRKG